MKQIKITCDACGKSNTDKEFEAPPLGTFHHGVVGIRFDMSHSDLSELDKLAYSSMDLDLCGECSEKFRKLISNFLYHGRGKI
jgi:hypothetical protein